MTSERPDRREHLPRGWLAVAPLSLFLFGALLCLYYGRDGFMPIDQSIIYDGAWRVLGGQVPLRDFLTPTGIVPILVQAGFFLLFGVNWFAYCLHAAVFNGVFAILAFAFLRQWGLGRGPAWVFAMLSAVVMYVPSGTPLMEQDAFFFVLLACVAAGAGVRAQRCALLFLAAGTFLVVALFCKQNPALFGFPLVLWIVWTRARERRRAYLLWILAGVACGATAFMAVAMGLGIDWTWARLLLWELPGQIGRERLALLHIADPYQNWERSTLDKIRWGGLPLVVATTQTLAWLWLAAQIIHDLTKPARSAANRITRALALSLGALFVLALYPLLNNQGAWAVHIPVAARWLVPALTLLLFGWPGSLVAVVVGLALFGRERCGHILRELREQTALVGMMQALMFACVTFFSLTLNEECNGVPYYFVAMGLASETLRRVGQRCAPLPLVRDPWRYRLLPAAAAAVVVLAVVDSVRFHREVNLARIVNDDQKKVPRTSSTGGVVSPELSFMRFHIADVHQQMVGRMDAGDYRRVIEFFHAHRGNFFLFGDSTILYSLTGRRSSTPALWFHSGLVFPQRDSPNFQLFESWLTRRIDEDRCAYVVLEGRETLFGLTPSDFPALRHLIDTRGRARYALGAFTVIELGGPTSPAHPASRVASLH